MKILLWIGILGFALTGIGGLLVLCGKNRMKLVGKRGPVTYFMNAFAFLISSICAGVFQSGWPLLYGVLSLWIILLTSDMVRYLGNAYNIFGRHHKIESYKQTIGIKPFNLVENHLKLDRYQKEIDACKQIIRIKPNYAEAHYNLGVVYGKLGRYQDEIEACKQAIRIKPDYAEAHNNLGAAYSYLGHYQDGIESFKQAIKIKPDDAGAHFNLGNAYGKLGRRQDAIESYKRAIIIKPDYAEAHHVLGLAYLVTGSKDSAIEECKILNTLDTELANDLLDVINNP